MMTTPHSTKARTTAQAYHSAPSLVPAKLSTSRRPIYFGFGSMLIAARTYNRGQTNKNAYFHRKLEETKRVKVNGLYAVPKSTVHRLKKASMHPCMPHSYSPTKSEKTHSDLSTPK